MVSKKISVWSVFLLKSNFSINNQRLDLKIFLAQIFHSTFNLSHLPVILLNWWNSFLKRWYNPSNPTNSSNVEIFLLSSSNLCIFVKYERDYYSDFSNSLHIYGNTIPIIRDILDQTKENCWWWENFFLTRNKLYSTTLNFFLPLL